MYWTLFLTFVKIGTFTIGGGYAMLPLIQREVVDKGWLSKEDFIDLFSVAQSLPGIFAVNISIFVGYKLKKVPGGIVWRFGKHPSLLLHILAIALFFTHVQDNIWVEKAFKGLRPGGRRPDCRALPDNGTFDQDELQRAGYPYRCRTADLAGRVVSCVDYSGGYHRRTCLRTENKERLI